MEMYLDFFGIPAYISPGQPGESFTNLDGITVEDSYYFIKKDTHFTVATHRIPKRYSYITEEQRENLHDNEVVFLKHVAKYLIRPQLPELVRAQVEETIEAADFRKPVSAQGFWGSLKAKLWAEGAEPSRDGPYFHDLEAARCFCLGRLPDRVIEALYTNDLTWMDEPLRLSDTGQVLDHLGTAYRRMEAPSLTGRSTRSRPWRWAPRTAQEGNDVENRGRSQLAATQRRDKGRNSSLSPVAPPQACFRERSPLRRLGFGRSPVANNTTAVQHQAQSRGQSLGRLALAAGATLGVGTLAILALPYR